MHSATLREMIRSLWIREVSMLYSRQLIAPREPWPGWHYVGKVYDRALVIYVAAPLHLFWGLREWRRWLYWLGFIDAYEGQDFREARWTWNILATHHARRQELIDRCGPTSWRLYFKLWYRWGW
jgi:hypothetical protein